MEYFVAKAPNPEIGEGTLHPDWFSVSTSMGRYAEIACEEYLKTKVAQKNKATIVKCEITEIAAN